MIHCSILSRFITYALALAAFCLVNAGITLVGAQTLPLRILESPNPQAFDLFSYAVAGVPDLNGDGRGDLLVGTAGIYNEGQLHVFDGATGALLRSHQSPSSEVWTYFGSSAAGLTDVNGDGRGDILVGAPNEDGGADGAGRAYLFDGFRGVLLRTLQSSNPQAGAGFGTSISAVPDVDGDGRDDLLIGPATSINGGSGAGLVELFSGSTGVLLRTFQSPDVSTVAGVPDVDGDGRGDILVAPTRAAPGVVYLFSGATGTLLSTLTSPNPKPSGYFGYALAGVADVNGDGRGELLIGAFGEGNPASSGRAYLFDGSTRTLLRTLLSPNPEASGYFGASVAGVTDVNGDGRGDLLIGARENDALAGKGRAYLYDGSTGALLQTVTSPNPEDFGAFGQPVASVPDVDGDRRADLLVGAIYQDGGATDAGRAYLFSGSTDGALTVNADPVRQPVVIPPQGGSFSFTYTATNTTTQAQTFQLWTRLTKPDGTQTPALIGPITRTLAAGASTTGRLKQAIAESETPGLYTYTVYVGTYPDIVLSSDAFTFTKRRGPPPPVSDYENDD